MQYVINVALTTDVCPDFIKPMNVVLIYLNQKSVERQVKKIALTAIHQKFDFSRGGIAHHPFFNITQGWPSKEQLDTLPLQYQCEEVKFRNNRLATVRKLVIDIDSSLIRQLVITDKSA